MGYQNNERPADLMNLVLDAKFDLTDLREELMNILDDEELDIIAHIDWIKDTLDMVENKLLKSVEESVKEKGVG